MALTQVDSGGVKDDSIVNADIKSDAAIDLTKLNSGSLPNGIAVNQQNIAAGQLVTGHIAAGTGFQISNSNVSDSAAIAGSKLADDSITEVKLDVHNAPSGTDKFLAYTSNGMEWAVPTDTNTQLSFANDANNRVVTGTGSGLNGEANLTFDGDHVTQTIDASGEGFNQTAAGNHFIENLASANRSSADGVIWRQTADWNGKTVAQVKMAAGSDTTNKDDGYITFWTSAADDNAERVRIDSSGRVLIGTTTEGYSSADDLTIETAGHTGITIRSGTSSEGALMFSDGTSGADEYRGFIQYKHSNNNIDVGVNSVEKIRIHTDGTTSFATGIGLGNALNYAAANTLEDYEEGSFTPNDGSGNSVGLTMESGCRYTKIGNQVHIECDFHIATNSVSAVLKLGNLPFTPVNYSGGVVNWTHYNDTLVAHCGSGGIWLNKGDNTDGTFNWSDMSNKRVIFALTYTTTS